MTRRLLAVWTAGTVVFLLAPIALIILYAFNPSNVQGWPLDGLSTKWFSSTFANQEMRDALWLSVRAGFISTSIALVLGSLAAFAVVPVAVMALYLLLARRLGAFEAL